MTPLRSKAPRVDLAVLIVTLLIGAATEGCRAPGNGDPPAAAPSDWPIDRVEPRSYVCRRAAGPLSIDGRLDEDDWRSAPETELFVDIEGDAKPAPRFATRARMLWDDHAFYFAAELEEPELWATLTARDSVIYRDNDFEVFLDPDGDTQLYYELEINALGTEWDLLLVRPYRDGGPAVHAWDLPGLETAVDLRGTLNDPGAPDRGWSVEIAMPWSALAEAAGTRTPPEDGDVWRVNFSRVEWLTRVENGRHVKVTDPATGEPLPEDNWVWSPQGVIAMHRPETWGLVQFSSVHAGEGEVRFVPPDDLLARKALRRVYEASRAAGGARELDLARPALERGWSWPPELFETPSLFEATLRHRDGRRLHVAQDGRIWTTPTP